MPKDRIVERSVTLQRINFLKGQIDDLDGYFPDTYQFLIDKIDAQKRILGLHSPEKNSALKKSQ